MKRLEGSNLVQTSLLTSLHDAQVDHLNKGFNVTRRLFEKIINSTNKIVKFVENPEILQDLLKLESDDTIEITGLSLASVVIGLLALMAGVILKQNKVSQDRLIELTEELEKSDKKRDIKVTESKESIENRLKDLEATLIAVMTQTIRGAVADEAARLHLMTAEAQGNPSSVMTRNQIVLPRPMMVQAGPQDLQLVANGRSNNVSLPSDDEIQLKVAQALSRAGRDRLL